MLKQLNRVVFQVECGKGIETLQISDVHYDSMKCDRELLTKHLKEAEAKKALVVINGDLFDLMGGKYDPRSSYSDIRPEYKSATYLDDVINDAIQYFSKFKVPYLIGRGNHETNIIKRLHSDPTERLVQGLKMMGVECMSMGYSGYIIYSLAFSKTMRASVIQHFHHGYGGNAPRSKGILKVDLNMMQNPNADIITRGHDHNKWHVPTNVQRINQSFNIYMGEVHSVQTGSYKFLGDGYGGWAVEKGFNQPRLGGWWIKISSTRQAKKVIKVIEAI